jgi:hypothetical protein
MRPVIRAERLRRHFRRPDRFDGPLGGYPRW